MSTQTQGRKVQHIETLGSAAADVEMHGQKLRDALAQVYWSAQNGDAQKLTSAYTDATEHAGAMRKTVLSATEAMDALIGEPEPDLDKFRDLVTRVEEGVRKEEEAGFARMRRQIRKAEALIYALALSSFGRAFYYASKGGKASLPLDDYPEARFANELSRLAYDIIDTLGGTNDTNEIDVEAARSYARSAVGRIQILVAALGSDDDRYDEQRVAEHSAEIIASVARELETCEVQA